MTVERLLHKRKDIGLKVIFIVILTEVGFRTDPIKVADDVHSRERIRWRRVLEIGKR
jgi:hypothetical protein